MQRFAPWPIHTHTHIYIYMYIYLSIFYPQVTYLYKKCNHHRSGQLIYLSIYSGKYEHIYMYVYLSIFLSICLYLQYFYNISVYNITYLNKKRDHHRSGHFFPDTPLGPVANTHIHTHTYKHIHSHNISAKSPQQETRSSSLWPSSRRYIAWPRGRYIHTYTYINIYTHTHP